MSTASLIALSAQATFCAPCICSASSAIRRRSSSGSPRKPKGSSEDMPGFYAAAARLPVTGGTPTSFLLRPALAAKNVCRERVDPVEEQDPIEVVQLVLEAARLEAARVE